MILAVFMACSSSKTGQIADVVNDSGLDTGDTSVGLDNEIQADNHSDPGTVDITSKDVSTDIGTDTSVKEDVSDVNVIPPWSKTMDRGGEDYGFSVVTVEDGYLVAGSTDGGKGIEPGLLLVKYSLAGKLLWQKSYGDSKRDSLKAIASASDNGFFLTGYYYPKDRSDSDMIILKVDASGNEIWRRLINGDEDDEGWGVVGMDDGGCVAVGLSFDNASQRNDARIVRLDKTGKVVWNNTFGGEKHDDAAAVVRSGDGGVVVVGSTQSFGEGLHDIWLFKLDKDGKSVWAVTFGGAAEDYGYALTRTSDNGYAIAGTTNSYTTDIQRDLWVVRADSKGDRVWDNHYSDEAFEYGRSIVQTKDGGFVIAGSLMDNDKGTMDALLARTDAAGEFQWFYRYDKGGKDGFYGLTQAPDQGFVAVGYAKTTTDGNEDLWIEKTDSNGIGPDKKE